jgi:putative ABC transport system substrate-binding protein
MKRVANALVFAIALALCTSSSDAQQSAKVFRVGVLALGSAEDMQNRLALLREPLRYLGYEEGKNLVIESRFANSDYERLPVLAGELARLKLDVFVAAGEPALLAAKEKGENIPIVVVSCDPLEKLLGSLARPGGNATGFTCVSSDLVGKRFSLLRSLLPGMRRVAMLYNKRDNHELEFRDGEAAAQSLNIALLRFPVVSAADFESTFKMMNEEKSDALYIFASGFAQGHWTRLAQLALDHRLPDLRLPRIREPRWAIVVRSQQFGRLQARGRTRRQNPQGIAAVGFAGRAADPSSMRGQLRHLASKYRRLCLRWPTR